MDKEKNCTVYVGYVPGRRGSVLLLPFDLKLTDKMFDLEQKYVHLGLEICKVNNIEMYGEYLPVLAEASTLYEFEQLILEKFGGNKADFQTLVKQVANKNSDILKALADVEKGEVE